MNAYPSATDLMAYAPAEWTLPDIQSTLLKQHQERLQDLASKAGLLNPKCHLIEGHMAPAVNQVANDINAKMVVVSSRCRTGIEGFFMGNAVESLLETCQHNIFVIKTDS